MEEEQNCGNCRFMIDGVCKRYPPFNNVWPTVAADDWCGEWCMQITDYTPPSATGDAD